MATQMNETLVASNVSVGPYEFHNAHQSETVSRQNGIAKREIGITSLVCLGKIICSLRRVRTWKIMAA